MKRGLELNMVELVEIFEDFRRKIDTISQSDLIDLAARLKPVAKACETIDTACKTMVKAKLHEQEGSLNGELFKAVLKEVPTHRLNQGALREGNPVVFDKYNEEVTDLRVTFELR